jgi:BirA family biotin operon repressor/biotin-[acetyl-CoA-carboxylase] ligase
VPLLDHERIVADLLLPVRTRLSSLEVLWEVDSTSARLFADSTSDGPAVCVAEVQTAGRGRRGRAWHAPFGTSVCLSLSRPFRQLPSGFGGIGLVAGVAVANALAALGYHQVGLKWPNDLVADGAKLGGLLVESRGESGGAMRVVIGVGINWRLSAGALDGLVDQPYTHLAALPVSLPSRDAIVAQLLNALIVTLDEFSSVGFDAFRTRWEACDVLRGRNVTVTLDRETVSGTAIGIDGEGALRVATADGERRFTGGEVSVREDV